MGDSLWMVNHLGAEPGTQAYSAWACPLWQAGLSTRHSWGSKRDTPTRITWSRSVRWCLAVGLACGDPRRLTGNGSALEALCDDALYKSTYSALLSRDLTCVVNVNCLTETVCQSQFCIETTLVVNNSRLHRQLRRVCPSGCFFCYFLRFLDINKLLLWNLGIFEYSQQSKLQHTDNTSVHSE